MNTLYEISSEYQMILRDILEDEGELSPENEIALKNIEDDLTNKAINIASIIKEIEDDILRTNAAIQRMQKRNATYGRKVAYLKEMLKGELERCHIDKVKSPYFNIFVRHNPFSVVIDDDSLVPIDYYREQTTRILDKMSLSNALKANMCVPGAHLERRTRLDIK